MANKTQRRASQTGKQASRKAKPSKKSVRVNLPKQGLEKDINRDLFPKKQLEKTFHPVTWVSVPSAPGTPRRMSEFDREYITRLITKHGPGEYFKMFMDRKTNCDQLTMTQLRNLVKKLEEDNAKAD